jgi:hypothetical protein
VILLTENLWEIKQTANKGRGLFAAQDLPAGQIISDYLGLVLNPLTDDVSEKLGGLYLMYYHDRALLYPTDITQPGAHVVNHSCLPNCWVYTFCGHTLFFTLRKIFAGEELTISYLLAPNTSCSPCSHQCFCNTFNCSGSMHLSAGRFKQWNTFHEWQSHQTKRKQIRYGKKLGVLPEYPNLIPDQSIYYLSGSLDQPPLILNDRVLPSLPKMRQLIRQTGLTLQFPKLKLHIKAIENGTLIR